MVFCGWYLEKLKRRSTELTISHSMYSLIYYMNDYLSKDLSGLLSLNILKNSPVNDIICIDFMIDIIYL